MKKNVVKRVAAWVLIVLMVFSDGSLQTLAAAGDEHVHAEETADEVTATADDEQADAKENTDLQVFQKDMEKILKKYLGKTVMSEKAVQEVILDMDEDTFHEAEKDIEAFEKEDYSVSEKEKSSLGDSYKTYKYFSNNVKEYYGVEAVAEDAGTFTPVEGMSVKVTNEGALGAGQVTATSADGSLNVTATTSTSFLASQASAKLVFTNTSGVKATISFDWESANGIASLQIDGTSTSETSGSYTKELAAGGTLNITFKSPSGKGNAGSLAIKNIQLVGATANTTFTYDEGMGTVTFADEVLASGSTKEIPSSGVRLVATPKEGYSFLGWRKKSDSNLLSTNANYKLMATEEMEGETI